VTGSYDVRFWRIDVRKDRPTPYRVRWVVSGYRFSDSFRTMALAESFKAQLITLARNGEAFDPESGLPESLVHKQRDVSFLAHSREFMALTWNGAAAKSRVSTLETLSFVVPVVTRNVSGPPDPEVVRHALRRDLNQGDNAGTPDAAEARALAWLAKASRPVSAFQDASVVCDVLDVLATRLDGKPAAAEYFARRRRVMHRVLGYAVRKNRLAKNPLSKHNLPDGWTPPPAPEDAVDPRSVGSPRLLADMLAACSYVGQHQGERFVAFYGCMYYAMMRPSEVVALTRDGCTLPSRGWGYLTFADSSPAAGSAFTDDGQVHEHRGLKGRSRGRTGDAQRSRRPVRKVPIPPELVSLLRQHLDRFGTDEEGRLFRSEQGNPIQPSTWWQVWKKVRALSLTPAQRATPLLQRPYDLRHSGVTWRLNSGVPPTDVAAWAGHSVEVLMRVYAKCMIGLEDVWIGRMDQALHLQDERDSHGPQSEDPR
jgi:integrase